MSQPVVTKPGADLISSSHLHTKPEISISGFTARLVSDLVGGNPEDRFSISTPLLFAPIQLLIQNIYVLVQF